MFHNYIRPHMALDGKTPAQVAGIQQSRIRRQEKLASNKLAERVGEPFVSIVTREKQELFILDPETLKERVHRDFPEYRKSYTELDEE